MNAGMDPAREAAADEQLRTEEAEARRVASARRAAAKKKPKAGRPRRRRFGPYPRYTRVSPVQ